MSTRKYSTCVIDLGHAIARVTREGYGDHITTRLTLLTPASDGEHSFSPAASVEAYVRAEQMPALIAALTAEPLEVEL
jgi:hypothetical protein